MSIHVSYPAKRVVQVITDAEHKIIHDLYACDKKVMAIKFLREQHNLGLYEAKMICDTIWNEPHNCAKSF